MQVICVVALSGRGGFVDLEDSRSWELRGSRIRIHQPGRFIGIGGVETLIRSSNGRFILKVRTCREYPADPYLYLEVSPADALSWLIQVDQAESLPPDLSGLLDAACGPIGTPRPEPEAPQPVPEAEPSRLKDPGLSVDDRAVALLTRWSKEGRKITVVGVARELGASRSYLYRCETFMHLWNSMKASRYDLPRGSKDRDTRTVEAWEGDR